MKTPSGHPDPTNEPVELQTAIGRLVMAWAYLEAALDGIASALYQKFDNGQTGMDELPRAFSRKADYIKKCFKKIAALNPLEPQVSSAINEALVLSVTRNIICHGFILSDGFPLPGEQFVQFKMDYGKNIHDLSEQTFTADEIFRVSTNCLKLTAVLAEFGDLLPMLAQTLNYKRDDPP